MKCVMVMFDSLNRHLLPPYGCEWTLAPHFERLARHTATFETSYVCSMPCMPARRDLHTGRPNFLHRSWGPLEPFDDSLPQMLRDAGVYTHLVTDHYHYWEDGGATYHNRYSSYEFFRGQEGDPWKGVAGGGFGPSERALGRNASQDKLTRQDRVNRTYLTAEVEMPQALTFAAGLEFLERNHGVDNWLLQIETFDPHEPFFTQCAYRDQYAGHQGYEPDAFDFDWPAYRPVDPERGETPAAIRHIRHEYAALLSMCDRYLGSVLDTFDRLELWHDTMLVVWTDHGFLLGEHGCWAKNWLPFYQEIAHTPFFVWDPRHPESMGQRRSALVQPSVDLAPTLLRFFGLESTPDMLGKDLAPVLANDTMIREAAIFGVHGRQVNVTDGRHIYMRGPDDPERASPPFNYTLMPTHMQAPFAPDSLRDWEPAPPFAFTKGCRTMKIPTQGGTRSGDPTDSTLLWDVAADPTQTTPLDDPTTEARMVAHLTRLMRECDAPAEQFARLGLATPHAEIHQ